MKPRLSRKVAFDLLHHRGEQTLHHIIIPKAEDTFARPDSFMEQIDTGGVFKLTKGVKNEIT